MRKMRSAFLVTLLVLVCTGLALVAAIAMRFTYGPCIARSGQPILNAVFEYREAKGEWPSDMEDLFLMNPKLRKIAGWHYQESCRTSYMPGDWIYRKEEAGGFWLGAYPAFSKRMVLCRVVDSGGGAWEVAHVDSGFVVPVKKASDARYRGPPSLNGEDEAIDERKAKDDAANDNK